MNKFKFFFLAAFLTLAAGIASAQKTGYISLDQVVANLPEAGRLDSIMQRYQADSLNPQFAYMVSEYNRKDSIVNGKDSSKTPASVRAQMRQEMEQYAYQIQNWQAVVQNAMQGKQNELLEPMYRKAMNALNAVAKENGYTYVYNKEVLLVAPPSDDLLPLVAKKLGIKLQTTASTGTGTPK
jgi:outer membrane protein